jgi:4-diphosphocytidyl-2-C-methyl-D-erythritol kinase
MRLAAHAKINLTLEVLGVRPDGYHSLRSVVTTIPLHDDVELEDASPGEVAVEMTGDGVAVPCVPPEANLAVRAARALQKASGAARGVRIRIVKRIPAGAGLGGGSADAAAVLNGLNELWGLSLPTDRLCVIGAEVGSDVPALVLGGTVLMEGRGETVTPLPRSPRPFDARFVLRVPPVCASTACVYEEFRAEDRGKYRNDLQPAACRLYPAIAETVAEMEAEGLENVQMTGSGSAVFGWRRESI